MNTGALMKKLLGLPVVTKSRTGFLTAVVAITTLAGEVTLSCNNFLRHNDAFVCMGVGLLGFIAWLTGRLREASQGEPTPVQDAPAEEAAAEHPLAFLASLKYWGVILVLLAGILSCLAAWRRHEPVRIVRARPLQRTIITVTNVVTITNVAPMVSFPHLELQGVVVNGARSSALINGRILRLGEGISNAVLVGVDSERALVAMDGQTNALSLR